MTIEITCARCNQTSPMDAFCISKTGQPLGLDNYRCPSCGIEFHRFHMPPYYSPQGDVRPGKIFIKPGRFPGGYTPTQTMDVGRWRRQLKEKRIFKSAV